MTYIPTQGDRVSFAEPVNTNTVGVVYTVDSIDFYSGEVTLRAEGSDFQVYVGSYEFSSMAPYQVTEDEAKTDSEVSGSEVRRLYDAAVEELKTDIDAAQAVADVFGGDVAALVIDVPELVERTLVLASFAEIMPVLELMEVLESVGH